MKYARVILTKEANVPHDENYKTLVQEIENEEENGNPSVFTD